MQRRISNATSGFAESETDVSDFGGTASEIGMSEVGMMSDTGDHVSCWRDLALCRCWPSYAMTA